MFFRHLGFAFWAFDFSTSEQSRLYSVAPVTRSGNVVFNLQWEKDTDTDLTGILFTEHTSAVEIQPSREVMPPQ